MGEDNPDEPPPSYSEAIAGYAEPPRMPQRPSQSNYNPPPPPQRELRQSSYNPPPTPSRPLASNSASTANRVSSGSSSFNPLYNNNPDLPFEFPKKFLCSKCKNTGYKIKNGKMCTSCWQKFYISSHAYNPNLKLKFKYPKGYLCEKCENTGFKKKNGAKCTDCSDRFMRRIVAPPPVPSNRPIRVLPGDPRLGGQLCYNCHGSGLVMVGFFSEAYCHICSGSGRYYPPVPVAPVSYYAAPPPGPPFGH